MKSSRSSLLEALFIQNDILGRARAQYLAKDAEKKHFEANLILNAPGSSMAERKVNAEALGVYLEFHQALARLEAIYEFQKLKFEVMSKEWQDSYLERKLDQGLISKQE